MNCAAIIYNKLFTDYIHLSVHLSPYIKRHIQYKYVSSYVILKDDVKFCVPLGHLFVSYDEQQAKGLTCTYGNQEPGTQWLYDLSLLFLHSPLLKLQSFKLFFTENILVVFTTLQYKLCHPHNATDKVLRVLGPSLRWQVRLIGKNHCALY